MMDRQKEENIFRDTPVRYLGYANEVGEAFRSIVPKPVVWFSYIVASGYVLADTCDSGIKVYKTSTSSDKNKKVIAATMDTLLWQALASIIIPGYTINRICAAVQYLQRRSRFNSKWIPTVVGLSSIPFIIKPIDRTVDAAMDATTRKWTGHHPPLDES
ncbi:mitochondrial fission process protein 1 [Prorops nasuta]|uniref:mitochondrial fission process protein 1 n=1 Tax=Prorops nasuta TaxID=863751 RepID=UPI0034CEAA82